MRGIRKDNVERYLTRKNVFEMVQDSRNTCIVFPTNPNGLRLIKQVVALTDTKNLVIFFDEHDEIISSYHKNRTIAEKATYEVEDDDEIIILRNIINTEEIDYDDQDYDNYSDYGDDIIPCFKTNGTPRKSYR
jgi:intein/homing endonuclease